MRLRLLTFALGALLSSGTAVAAEAAFRSDDPEVHAVQTAFDVGRYAEAIDRARARIDRGELADVDLVGLHKYAGLAALNLDRTADAERHFTALLRISPDHVLDPFAVPPVQIAFFDGVKRRLEPQLELIREEKRLVAERRKREEEERLRRQAEQEERRRRLEELSRTVTIRTVEKRAFLVNFVPFGAGQFQQGRTTHGVVVASSQALTALTSVVAYFAYEGLLKEQRITVDTIEGPQVIVSKVVPRDRITEANTWRLLKYASAGAFYSLYGYGVVDAIYHHQDEVVTTTQVQPPAEPERAPQPTRGYLFPTSGGLGAGLTLQF